MSKTIPSQTNCLINDNCNTCPDDCDLEKELAALDAEVEAKSFAPDTLGQNRFWHVYIDVYTDGDFGFKDYAGVGSSNVNLYFEKLSAAKEFIENYLKEIIATFHSSRHEGLKDSFIDALDEFYNGNDWSYSFDKQMKYACYELDKDMGNQSFKVTVDPCEYVIGNGFVQYKDLDANEVMREWE